MKRNKTLIGAGLCLQHHRRRRLHIAVQFALQDVSFYYKDRNDTTERVHGLLALTMLQGIDVDIKIADNVYVDVRQSKSVTCCSWWYIQRSWR
ncbi:hypothetical protein MSAN_01151000 [Mycena sanguinolenta]|uniref:Uncharacterized protein n=1 Tax=Mycena sanguinolenta TaxID=230812 RepID=A0A8H6YNN5_9AGAR|nr:hypothetical protein MSAN_01151000 [Mycena sanguinolenta]